MNILQAHKYYWPRDGASKYVIAASRLLKKQGHTVVPFAMREPETLATPHQDFFVSGADLSKPWELPLTKKIQSAGRVFYSLEARRKLAALLNHTNIDIAHLHNIYHHISPSILSSLKKRGIPVVMTLHDYKLLSPNYTLFHHGQVHEEDARGWHLSCVRNKCFKNNRVYSALVTAEMIWCHKVMRYYERYIDKFIAPSRFILELCVRFGWPREKFAHLPHPVVVDEGIAIDAEAELDNVGTSDGGYVLYAGRLSEEKGLRALLLAAKQTSGIPYKIVGAGPLESELKKTVAREKMLNVTLSGFETGANLQASMAQARLIVLPSEWYENYSLSILEAKALGKVVIATDIGGNPELLSPGLLVPPADPLALAQALSKWYYATGRARREVGERLQKEAREINDPSRHVRALEELYRSLL